VLKRDRKIAGDTRHHRIGIAERDHAGCKMIPILVYQSLAVAQQIAAPLKALVQEVYVSRIAGRHARIDDFNFLAELNAGLARRLANPVLAPDQKRGAETLMHEARCRSDDLFFLAFGEDDALGLPTQPVEYLHKRAGDRIAPRTQLLAVGVHINDRLARNAGIHRGLRDSWWYVGNQAWVERNRNDIVSAEFRARTIGAGDFVRNVFAREFRERTCGSDLHLHVDGGSAHIERAAKDVGKSEYVVDLVRVVGTTGRHDGVVAHRGDFLRRYFGVGIGHGEDDRLGRHRLDHGWSECAL